LKFRADKDRLRADFAISTRRLEMSGEMFARVMAFTRVMADGRFFGFDAGDWSMLLGGFAVAGLVVLLQL
jgi:hypothetical protein